MRRTTHGCDSNEETGHAAGPGRDRAREGTEETEVECDDGDDHGDEDDVDDLVVGAIVHEAEFESEHGLVTWDEIELLK
jgi:hypothetical protein